MTQEQGSTLKVGDKVNVYFFSPRKPKKEVEPPTRFWDGRTEWVDSVWQAQEVEEVPHHIPYDGWSVKLKGHKGHRWLTSSMEKA